MAEYVGFDVSMEETAVCVMDGDGRISWRGKCLSTPERMAGTLRAHAPQAERIVFETGALSTWHWHKLHDMGFPVVCVDARRAKKALSMYSAKTDRIDAEGLAQLARTGWYTEVQVKGVDKHRLRSALIVRAKLVGVQRDLGTQMRGILKTFGLIVGKASGKKFARRVRELASGEDIVSTLIDALLTAWETIGAQIARVEKELRHRMSRDSICRLLMSAPGVGFITALAYVTVIDDPHRFRHSASVGVYLGLTPRRYQSGEMDYSGHISHCGDALLRSYLFEAANVLLTRVRRGCLPKTWAATLAKKVGTKKAKVALARKLAVILHRMWIDNASFCWTAQKP